MARKLYVPINATPSLTSGRNGSGWSSGHHPIFVLDGNPDTWWLPDDLGANAVWVDLGRTLTVDAIAIWLHNYNEIYEDDGDKFWQVSYSHDDITYNSVGGPLYFARTVYAPIVLTSASFPVSARYWRIDVGFFNYTPQTIRAEISAVWFLNDYTLPRYQQKPERNAFIYHNKVSITRSGHRMVETHGVGKQRIMDREFIFVADVGEYAQLSDAYHAAQGRNKVLIMQTDLDSDEYRACRFTEPLNPNIEQFGWWRPTVRLREVGYKRVPWVERVLQTSSDVIGLYHFRSDFIDYSSSSNDLTITEYGSLTYDVGYTEQGLTKAVFNDSADLSSSSTDFEFGTDDFTIETWVRHSVGVYTDVVRKFAGPPYDGWRLLMQAANTVRLNIGDGTNTVAATTASTAISDGNWHYIAVTVNRTADEVRIYIDGALDSNSPHSIAAITGSLSSVGNPFKVQLTTNAAHIDELAIHTRALSAAEILTRYNGKPSFGDWGM
jgi:hypothetical protein